MLAGYLLRQVFSLLSIIAPAPDLINAEVGMRAIREAHRRGRAGNFLHRHHMFQITKAQDAPFLLDGDAMQPQLPHFRSEGGRRPILRIDLSWSERRVGNEWARKV